MKNRDVTVVDKPGTFLQTKVSDNTIIKLQGAIVKTKLKINPSWEDLVVLEGKKQVPTIYSEELKALYGTVDMKHLFYNNICHVHTLGVRNDHKTCHMAHQTRHMVTFGRYIFNNDLMVSLWCLWSIYIICP